MAMNTSDFIDFQIERIGCSQINWSPTSLGISVDTENELVTFTDFTNQELILQALKFIPLGSGAEAAAAVLRAFVAGAAAGGVYEQQRREESDYQRELDERR